MKLELKYFQAYIIPCVLYGLGALTLGKALLEGISIVKRTRRRALEDYHAKDESQSDVGKKMVVGQIEF